MTERTLVRYRPAATGWWVAAENGAVAVLAPAVSAGTATAVWRKVGGGGIGAVIEALTGAFGTSLSAIPPFALAVAEAGGVRVAVRGAVEVVVEGDGGAESVSGEGVATWTERFLPGATRITIVPEPAADAGGDAGVGGGADAADENVPLRSGVVRAVMIVADLPAVVGGAAAAVPAPAAVPAAAGEAGAAAVSVPATATAAASEAVPAAGEARAAAVLPATAAASEAVPAAADAEESTDAGAPGDGEEAGAAAPSETATETVSHTQDAADTLLPMATQPPSDVDERMLWGETVARPSAVLPDAGGDHGDQVALDEGDHDGETIAASGRPRGLPPAPVFAPAAPPLATPAPASASAPAPAAVALGDHDGETIAVADMRAMRAAEPDRYESTDSVPARHPARGRIRLSTGRVVELERPVIIGRRPKSTRTSGSDLPTLVAVDSPEQDISRSHVEIRAEGEHVLVTDLDTTNGTVLLRGGQEPVRLHPGEPTMVITGDVLDLGDGVTVAFEDLP
ncbi:FHA domain-containing protein [Microbacterium sp. CH-015]|uniref:FHA domain-containing protein n=1 Tax=Microbacterium sp. CH-015 TaxID=3406734 RepID=UPI003C72DBDE